MMASQNPSERRWRQVRNWIARQIESGEWAAKTKLPSIRILAHMFKSSIATIQRALADLEANAYVHSLPRIGYFVSDTGRIAPVNSIDFSAINIDVNHAVVSMLSQAAFHDTTSLSSAVLHNNLTPDALLNKCLTRLASKADSNLSAVIDPPGFYELRRRIAGLMLDRGVCCGPDDILITSGDGIALELALEAVAPRGAMVAIETPTYYGILQVIERLNMRALPIRTCPQQGIDLDHLEEALAQLPIAAIFLNPTLQNPRGFIMPNHARARLSALAQAANVAIIEDDIFFDLVPVQERPKAIKSYIAADQVIYCCSFSKTVAPGYRVGWCLAGKYRDSILAQMFSRNLSVSSLAQKVLSEFVGRGYMAEHCHKLQGYLAAITKAVATVIENDFPQGTRYIAPRAGFIHWLELPDNTDMLAFEAATALQGCHVTGSSIFYADRRLTTGLRLCIGTQLSTKVIQDLKKLAVCAHQSLRI